MSRSKRLIKKLLKRVIRKDPMTYFRYTNDGKKISDIEILESGYSDE